MPDDLEEITAEDLIVWDQDPVCVPEDNELPADAMRHGPPPSSGQPGKWVGLDWVYDPDAAADVGYRSWRADFFERMREGDDHHELDREEQRGQQRGQLQIIPQNLDVVRLAQEITKRRASGESQRSIAIQFTEGDEKQAASLLRQLRRYKRLRD
ncbi:MAG TPA: hypothetical protein VMP01_06870 [Pirellulaceae bacterium]|nr:hypothetical protein [Pirellulaceae bacterium]